jgi:hypothetical protein
MKKITIILIGLFVLSVGLVAQTNPRTLYVRLVNQDGSSLPNNTEGITFQARLMKPNAGELNQSSNDCGFYFAGGNLYAKVQLGNFNGINWAQGDRVEMDVQRASDNSVGSDHNIIIPDNTGTAIWWGRPPSGTTTYPGNPIYLIPIVTNYTLTVTSTPDGKPIYKDNVDTGQVTPYTFNPGEAGIYKVVDPLYNWNPPEIVVPELTENTTINFVGTPIPDTYTYNLHIQGPEGYAVTGPTAELSGIIPYTKTSTVVTDLVGNYTVAAPPAGYQWVMNPITVTADMFQLATKKTGGMNKVVLGSRTNGAKANYVYEATITFVMEPIPVQYYNVLITSEPAGAAILVDNVDTGFVTPYTFTMEEGASATYTVVMDHYTWNPTEFVVTNISENMSCNFVGTPYYDIPDGVPTTPTGATVTVTITITGGNANYGSGVLPPWVNPSFTPIEQYFLSLIGTGPWTITFNTTAPWAAYFLGGIWHAVQNTGLAITFTIDVSKDVPNVPVVLGNEDPTLPVELSYFAATLTAENFVNIAWTTQTETNMNGFNIYRNDGSDNLASAIQIAYIPATNTSTTQNYEHLDNKDLENGHTYYYWLECVEISGHSTFNGPRSAYVDGPTTPELPNCTTMHNAYPNPFRAGSGTTIAVEVKKGDSGTVTIYNILGQVVKTFSLTEGTNNLNWNGRDSKGNLCGNGIYFYKLSTNSLNQTKKMVIVK